MHFKKNLLLILTLLPVPNIFAQKVKLLNATRQVWREVSTHRHGVSYKFNISFLSFPGLLKVDTLWLGNDPMILNSINTQWFQGTGYLRVEIAVQKEITNEPDQKSKEPKISPHIHPPFKYHGVALLSYIHNNKKHYYVIPRTFNTLTPVVSP
jgi:hypothetical protein